VLGSLGSASGVNLDYPSRAPPGATWSERYQQALRERQQAAKQYAADYPATSTGAEAAGTVLAMAPGAALTGSKGLIGEIARNIGLGAAAGTAAATPQATQEPTWGRTATDLSLGAGIGGIGGGATSAIAQPQVVKPLVGALANAAAPATGAYFGGPVGAFLGKEILQPLTQNIGPWMQRWMTPPLSWLGRTAAPGVGAVTVRNLLPGQSAPTVP
jgi:hypothetical protein